MNAILADTPTEAEGRDDCLLPRDRLLQTTILLREVAGVDAVVHGSLVVLLLQAIGLRFVRFPGPGLVGIIGGPGLVGIVAGPGLVGIIAGPGLVGIVAGPGLVGIITGHRFYISDKRLIADHQRSRAERDEHLDEINLSDFMDDETEYYSDDSGASYTIVGDMDKVEIAPGTQTSSPAPNNLPENLIDFLDGEKRVAIRGRGCGSPAQLENLAAKAAKTLTDYSLLCETKAGSIVRVFFKDMVDPSVRTIASFAAVSRIRCRRDHYGLRRSLHRRVYEIIDAEAKIDISHISRSMITTGNDQDPRKSQLFTTLGRTIRIVCGTDLRASGVMLLQHQIELVRLFNMCGQAKDLVSTQPLVPEAEHFLSLYPSPAKGVNNLTSHDHPEVLTMDPASAIGVASGVLSFVEWTYKFLTIVYDLYESGQVDGYSELATASRMVRESSDKILTDATSTPAGPSDRGLTSMITVAQQSRSLAVDLENHLAKTKPKSQKMGDILKAAVRTVCSKSDIERLQRALDSCRSQLHLQLTMNGITHRYTALYTTVQKLEAASAALFDATERARAKLNQRNILSSLRFGSMDDRYDMVSEAADTTFDWIFDNQGNKMASSSALVRRLKDWLAQGTGVFHISGKPGAGKSTLMKYLCTHDQTRQKLRSWSDPHPLIMANFFFWKPGRPEQKNQDGMMRSLLYQILTEHPDAIAELFAKQWDPTRYDLWSEPGPVQLDNKDVVKAFGRLLSEPNICDHARFCFFLDGLDEFEDGFKTNQHLVTTLLRWMGIADGRLRLCVSSRELPVFQQNFPIGQRIRLQDLTHADITAVTHQTLQQHPEFQRRQARQPQECSTMMSEIVKKSDGVFLWVTLTLKMVMQNLEDAESITAIRTQVDRLPEELEDFFRFIMETIPKYQRRKAYCSLLYVCRREVSWPMKRRDWAPNGNFEPLYSMLRLSFLDEYLDNNKSAHTLGFTPLDEQSTLRRIDTATTQIQARSRGLLEAWDTSATSFRRLLRIVKGKPRETRIEVAGAMAVRYSHRSIREFLDRFLDSDFAKPYLDGFDCIDAHINNYIALLKYSEFDTKGYQLRITSSPEDPYSELRNLVIGVQKAPNPQQYFGALDILEKTLCKIYAKNFVDFDPLRWEVYHSISSACDNMKGVLEKSHPSTRARLATPLYVACASSFYQYVLWKLDTFPDAWKECGNQVR
ncbi:hypothetical protein QBC39DRAFT_331433 [Podospora conica]|nr:hypothetical protein QBC39DRAFT_331433 [Schizothecium conicum]